MTVLVQKKSPVIHCMGSCVGPGPVWTSAENYLGTSGGIYVPMFSSQVHSTDILNEGQLEIA